MSLESDEPVTTIRLYVDDLMRRSRVETAAGMAGMRTGEGSPDLVVVDLSDEEALARYLRERPAGRVVGFYPHVRRELAEIARSHGIEPYENRTFFENLPELLRSLV